MVIFISGLTNKRLLVSLFLLFLAGMAFGADKFTVTPPTFTGSNPDEIDILNKEAIKACNTLKDQLNKDFDFLPDSFDKLAGGFSNAFVFSSDGASQRGYEGYNAFCFTVGPMLALTKDSFKYIMSIFNNSDEATGSLKHILNSPFGFSAQISAQFGINTSKFLLEGLYLGFMFSKFDINWINNVIPISGLSFSTMSIGVNASYQLIRQKRLLAGLLVWRGLNLGTGFIWQNTSLNFSPTLSIDDVPITIPGLGVISWPVNAVIRLGSETKTYIIPVEAMTSIRFAGFLNMALGAGVDMAFGSTNINASGSLNVVGKPNGLPPDVDIKDPPIIKLNPLWGKSGPSIFNAKILGAVGFNFGPVIIDIPLTYYVSSNGYSIGFTLGVTL